MPFGGVKDSGFGRFGGQAVVDEFTELRWITIRERHAPLPVLERNGRQMAEIVPLSDAVTELVHDGDVVALEGSRT